MIDAIMLFCLTFTIPQETFISNGAGNGARTRDPQLGKLMLYQLSYARSQVKN